MMKKINAQPESAKPKSDNASIDPIYYILSCALFPIIVALLVILTIWRFIVSSILSFRYKDKFGGLLNRSDSVWVLDDVSKMIVNSIFIIDVESNNPYTLMKKIKETFTQPMLQEDAAYSKLWSIRQKALGYSFLIKNQVSIEDCVRILPTDSIKGEMTSKDLQHLVSKYSNTSLPKDDCALWECLVSDKPIMWNNSMRYPVIMRLNHLMGDGFAMIQLISHNLSDSMPENRVYLEAAKNLNLLKDAKYMSFSYLESILKAVLSNIYVMLVGPAILMHQTRLRPDDKSSLHGVKLSGEKIAVWACEEKPKLIPIIKSIKNKLDSKFVDVILTALSESLNSYFTRKNEELPEFVTTFITQRLTFMDPSTKPVLDNNFSLGMLQLPILENDNYISNRLNIVKNKSKTLRESFDYQINYWLLNVVAEILPETLLKLMLNSNKCTMLFTNVPGVPELNMFGGHHVEDIVFWVPHKGTTGLGFSLLTYNNKIQLGLIVDKSLIASTTEAQLIVDNAFKCIEELHKEIL